MREVAWGKLCEGSCLRKVVWGKLHEGSWMKEVAWGNLLKEVAWGKLYRGSCMREVRKLWKDTNFANAEELRSGGLESFRFGFIPSKLQTTDLMSFQWKSS